MSPNKRSRDCHFPTIRWFLNRSRIATEAVRVALRRPRVCLCVCIDIQSSVATFLFLITNCVLMHRSLILKPPFHPPSPSLALCLASIAVARGLPKHKRGLLHDGTLGTLGPDGRRISVADYFRCSLDSR